jgi:heme oxygenase
VRTDLCGACILISSHHDFEVTVSSATKFLRDATLEHHREAERHVRILDPDATVATYTRFLARMFGFHAAIEGVLADHRALARAGYIAAERRKQHLLAADLHDLGLDPDLLDRCSNLLPLDSLPRALGAAYVVEGSTLGGSFIRTKLALRDVPTRFLAGYGTATGKMWKAFGELSDRALATAAARDEAATAARETFACLAAWLDEPARDAPHPNRALDRRVHA